jgi:hypothetical protein
MADSRTTWVGLWRTSARRKTPLSRHDTAGEGGVSARERWFAEKERGYRW